jgi:hypothetical protein
MIKPRETVLPQKTRINLKSDIPRTSGVTTVYAVWDKTKDLTRPTKFWKALLKADQESAKHYTTEEIMGEGDMIHNMCQISHRKKSNYSEKEDSPNVRVPLGRTMAFVVQRHSPQQGKLVQQPRGPKLRNFAVRLCKTNPREILIFDDLIWKGLTIISRQDMIAWTAARKCMGDIWDGDNKEFNVAKQNKDVMDINGEANQNK